MAGLAKLGDKIRSSQGAKTSNNSKTKRKETYYERAYRLKKEMPWPYNTLIDLAHVKKGE